MISKCYVMTDNNKKELVLHGTIQFPLACYSDDMNEVIVPWHWHDDFEIIFCTSGSAIANVVQDKISLAKGEALFINSRVIHSIEKSSAKIKSIVFNPKIIYGTNESVFHHDLILPFLNNSDFLFFKLQSDVPWQKKIISFTKKIWNKAQKENDEFQNDCRYLLTKIFYLLIEKCELKNLPEKSNSFVAIQNERVKKMILFIEENYSSEITLEQISAATAVSKNIALRDFKAVIKMSPFQYVKKIRIEKASEMLSTKDEKISAIALNCGFNDMSYFSKTFREQVGMTPEEFRRAAVSTGN